MDDMTRNISKGIHISSPKLLLEAGRKRLPKKREIMGGIWTDPDIFRWRGESEATWRREEQNVCRIRTVLIWEIDPSDNCKKQAFVVIQWHLLSKLWDAFEALPIKPIEQKHKLHKLERGIWGPPIHPPLFWNTQKLVHIWRQSL